MNAKETVSNIKGGKDVSLNDIVNAIWEMSPDSPDYKENILMLKSRMEYAQEKMRKEIGRMTLEEAEKADVAFNNLNISGFSALLSDRISALKGQSPKTAENSVENQKLIIAKKPRTINEAERKLLKEKTGIEYPTNFHFDDLTPASKKLLDGDKAVEKETVVNENDKNESRKPVVPDQKPYERELEVNEITPEYLNRNYSRLAMFADAANPLDENDAFYASSRDGLDMIDAKDENGASVDIREEIVDTAKLQTIYDLFASKNKVTQEEFNNRLRDNIDILGFTIINADRAATLAETGDTQTMRAEFRNRVDAYLGGGKKEKIDVKLDHVIGTLTAANQQIRQGVNKVKGKFGNIPAVQAFNNRINKVDEKLTKKFGQKYVKAKAYAIGVTDFISDVGLAALAGATGPVGMGIYAYYTFSKHALPFLQKAKESQMGYKAYAKAHKSEAAMAGLYTASSVLTGVVGAGVAAHNIATSAGATMADSFTKFASGAKIAAGFGAVGFKQVLNVKEAWNSGDPAEITKSVGKAALALGAFAIAAEWRNHYDLVPHGEHGAVVGPDGHEAAGNTIINNYYNNTENNYYDYSTHDNSTTVIDNCCDPCPDCEPVDVPPTQVTPKIVETPEIDVSGIKDPVLQPVPLTPEFVETPDVVVEDFNPELKAVPLTPEFVKTPDVVVEDFNPELKAVPLTPKFVETPNVVVEDFNPELKAVPLTPKFVETPDVVVEDFTPEMKPAEISRVVANTKGETFSVDEMFKTLGTEGVTQTANQVDGNLFMDAEKSTAADIKANADSLNNEMQKPLTEIKLETEIKASGEARNPNDMLQHLIAKKQNTK